MIAAEMSRAVRAVDKAFWGATKFEEQTSHAGAPELDKHLGIDDLFMTFDGKKDARGSDVGWGLALMEMLVDPMLSTWVPEWVVEQYERMNPFFRDVLRSMKERRLTSNAALLKQTKREMIKRHQRSLAKAAIKGEEKDDAAGEESGADSEASGACDSDGDAGAEELAAGLERDDEHAAGSVGILRDPRPEAGSEGAEADRGARAVRHGVPHGGV